MANHSLNITYKCIRNEVVKPVGSDNVYRIKLYTKGDNKNIHSNTAVCYMVPGKNKDKEGHDPSTDS